MKVVLLFNYATESRVTDASKRNIFIEITIRMEHEKDFNIDYVFISNIKLFYYPNLSEQSVILN